MGINSCNSLLWTADKISLRNLAIIHRAKNDAYSTCRVDIDVNNVVCTLFCGQPYMKSIESMATFAHTLSRKCGLIVTLVLDGDL